MLAIVATLFLTYVFGVSLMELLHIDVTMNNQVVEPIKAIGVSALIMVVLVLVALAIILSVFGSIIFIALLVMGSIAMVAIGVFWPVLLVAGLIWLVARDKKSAHVHA
jgi:hypothetical protein